MKEVMWAVDPIEGRRFKDSTERGAMVDFGDEPDLTSLERDLREQFGNEPFSIDDAGRDTR